MNSKSVLVTGGAGFIGSRLARRLLTLGYSVTVLDSLTPQIHGHEPRDLEWLQGPNTRFIRGTVTSRTDWEEALRGVEQVVHLAAETGTGQSMYEVEKYCATNSQGTALLIDVLCNSSDRQVRRVLLASSRSVYGEGSYQCNHCGIGRLNPGMRSPSQLKASLWEPICPQCSQALTAVPTSENDPVNPVSIYAATKYAQEDLIRIGCNSMGLGHVIFRLQNVFGEGQSLKNPYTGILSIFSTRIRREMEVPLFEDGLETRDFVHVDDVVEAFVLGLEAKEPINQIINVGTGVPTSVCELAQELYRAFGSSPKLVLTGQFRIGDIRHNFADISKLRTLLDFGPKVTLRRGLERFASWVNSQPIPDDGLEHALQELKRRRLMN